MTAAFNFINTEHTWYKIAKHKVENHPTLQELTRVEHLSVNISGNFIGILSEQQLRMRKEQYFDMLFIWETLMKEVDELSSGDLYLSLFDREGYILSDFKKSKIGTRHEASSQIDSFLKKGIPVEIQFEHEPFDSVNENESLPWILDYIDYRKRYHNSLVFPILNKAGVVQGFVGAGNFNGAIPNDLSILGYVGACLLEERLNQLEETRRYWCLLINSSPACTFILDEHARIIAANDKFFALLHSLGFDYDAPSFSIFRLLTESPFYEQELHSSNETPIKGRLLFKTADNQSFPCVVLSQQIINTPDGSRQLLVIIQKEAQTPSLKHQVINSSFKHLIGESPAIQSVKLLGLRAAVNSSNVLIEGESGTGKELMAEAIHTERGRKGAFIPVNCGAFSKELLRSELFGYEDGAFTGARKGGKKGLIEQANEGTVFLDEIGEMSVDMQVSLLRFLQNRHLVRVGGAKEIYVSVRIIAATNRDLKKEIERGAFREDLYYRLNVINIHMPPLRNRIEDIPILAYHILENLCNQFNITQPLLTQSALDVLMKYNWPGNVRELHNVIESALNVVQESVITKNDLPHYLYENKKSLTTEGYLDDIEKNVLINRLEVFKGNLSKTAKSLGVSRPTLYRKMKDFNLNPKDYRNR